MLTHLETDQKLPSRTSAAGWATAGLVLLLTAGSFALARTHFLLFHTLLELFCVLVSLAIGVMAWHLSRSSGDGFLVALGAAYPAVGALDLMHALSYKGMGLLASGTDTPTQLWIAARGLEVIALVVAVGCLGRRVRFGPTFAAYAAGAVLLLGLLATGAFPAMHIEGEGLTGIKVATEYVLIALLTLTALRLWARRRTLHPEILATVLGAIALTALAELLFTFYIGVYDVSNVLGHVAKLASFALVAVALLRLGGLADITRLSATDTAGPPEAVSLKDANARLWEAPLRAAVLDSFSEGAVVVDTAGRVRYMNRAARQLFGLGELEVCNALAVYRAEYELQTLAGERLAFDRWPVRRVLQGENLRGERYRVRRGDSPGRVVEFSGTPVEVDGRLAYALMTVREARTPDAPAPLRGVWDHYPFPVVVYDDELQVSFINRAAASLEALKPELPSGARTLHGALPKIRQALESGGPVHEHLAFEHQGRLLDLVFTYIPVVGAGPAKQVLGLGVPKEREDFAFAAAHDLKAPLRVVTAFSEILLEETRGEMARGHAELLERIRGAGTKMADLLEGIVRLTRTSTDGCQPRTVDLADIVRRCVDGYGLAESDILLDYPAQMPMRADPALLLVITDNLLRNAIKFTREVEAPRIEVGARPGPDVHTCWVRDNGIGFEPEFAEQVFVPFQRLQTNRIYEGEGLGLSIVKRAVERHGGEVWAESSPGAGATFFFTLPAGVTPPCDRKADAAANSP